MKKSTHFDRLILLAVAALLLPLQVSARAAAANIFHEVCSTAQQCRDCSFTEKATVSECNDTGKIEALRCRDFNEGTFCTTTNLLLTRVCLCLQAEASVIIIVVNECLLSAHIFLLELRYKTRTR
jgi:hypothetical protein